MSNPNFSNAHLLNPNRGKAAYMDKNKIKAAVIEQLRIQEIQEEVSLEFLEKKTCRVLAFNEHTPVLFSRGQGYCSHILPLSTKDFFVVPRLYFPDDSLVFIHPYLRFSGLSYSYEITEFPDWWDQRHTFKEHR